MQGAPAPFVGIDVEVDPFMADSRLLLQLQAPVDLFGTPVLAQESLHLLPSLPRNPRTIGLALPIVGQFIGLVVPIAFLAAVAPQFPRDGALMATDQRRYMTLVVAGFLQNVYLVSLFTGELVILHGVLLLTWRLEKHAHAIAACS